MIISIENISQLPLVSKQILDFAGNEKTFLFFGDMGVGKTTLIKAICSHLGVIDKITSPTYSLVNEYRLPTGILYHFDFYRIKDETEAYDMGFEEYLYSGNCCLIEWPEKIQNLWPEQFVHISLILGTGNERLITLKKVILKPK